MSIENNVCDCMCHTDANVMHIVACCEYCKYCDSNIRLGMMEYHKKECKRSRKLHDTEKHSAMINDINQTKSDWEEGILTLSEFEGRLNDICMAWLRRSHPEGIAAIEKQLIRIGSYCGKWPNPDWDKNPFDYE